MIINYYKLLPISDYYDYYCNCQVDDWSLCLINTSEAFKDRYTVLNEHI